MNQKSAIVIGGSIAGLLATKALSEHFEKVTLIERDELAFSTDFRKGVPQAKHAHALLGAGGQTMEKFFPGIVKELLDAGAVLLNMGLDFRWHHFGLWKKSFRSAVEFPSLSRPLLEQRIGQRVAALKNVTLLGEHDAVTLLADATKTRVIGLSIKSKEGEERTLEADLVVDASGRGSRVPAWLQSLGYPRPEEREVKVDIGYSSRIYKNLQMGPYKVLDITPKAPLTRLGAILPLEGGHFMVTLCGWMKDYPPGDEEGFLTFAKNLPMPDIFEAIKDATPISPISIHRLPSNLRRCYESMPRWPEGLLVMGDAVCSFNPVYGQGMSVASLEALALSEALKNKNWSAQKFQKQIAKLVNIPWLLATEEDFRYEKAEGKRPPGLGFLQWYVGRVHEKTASDEVVAEAFFHVMHMLKSPASLFHPKIMRRVLF